MFDFIGDKINLWFSSIELTKSKINEEFRKAVKIYNSKNSEILPENLYLNNAFLEEKYGMRAVDPIVNDSDAGNNVIKFRPKDDKTYH